MHYDWKIECLEAENVYTHTRMAYHHFHNICFRQCHLVVQVAFWAEVAIWAEMPPGLMEVRRCLCASSLSADSLLCHFGMKGSRPFDFYKRLPDVFLSHPSPFYAQETQLLASSLLRLRREVSWLVVWFPLLWRAKTLLWTFWPYSRQWACRTLLSVPNLLASPK